MLIIKIVSIFAPVFKVEIAEHYEQSLPELEEAVASCETKVKNHLMKMGFVI